VTPRHGLLKILSPLCALALNVLPVAVTHAEGVRPFTLGVHAGVRLFEEDLDLEDEVAFGLRAGLGASERFSVLLDFLQCSPARTTTGAQASVSALRGLTQARLLLGTVRPYLVAGVGGVLFNFDDTSDTAVGTITAGGGLEMSLGKRADLYAEGSADFYRARPVSYSSEGDVLSSGERDTQTAWTAIAGFRVTF
jgi:opacity protein-like surface antigen